ncbi:hypothetical protein QBC47DRAFT_209340 [Echria macrotheca]|uniref:Uncharacterized protein n=1 Tax=Echria macrotheca TaxID=438768 RepID=A0AAJ0BD75_9PEZI|nr:hypothetical protein QBC47DRAFT_209340 [Echria macrotheca]
MPVYTVPGRRFSARHLQSLPAIAEDVIEPPVIPQRSPRRSTLLNGQGTTLVSLESVLQSSSGSAPDQKAQASKEGFKQHDWLAERGGWYRFVAGTLLIIGLIVGLAVGLTVGLEKRGHSAAPAGLSAEPFPAGSYSFTTALTAVSTGCTNVSSTWRCFPYSIFDPQRPNISASTYFWVIEPLDRFTYAISSSENPFAPSFSNITLTLLDGNQDTERFIFSFPMEKTVISDEPLDSSENAATCRFRDTIMRVTIYTRMRAGYPKSIDNVPAPVNASNVFSPWPFAVDVIQESTSVPECRDPGGAEVGGDLRPENSTGCRCEYRNHDLPLVNTTNSRLIRALRL